MENVTILAAAREVKRVYDNDPGTISQGSSQWRLRRGILAIAGTNGPVDWFWNVWPGWKDGVKYGSWLTAQRILTCLQGAKPRLISCHSKSGPTGLYLAKKLDIPCVAFCPAPGFRQPETILNATIVIDPDDVVPKLGRLLFRHPVCEFNYLPEDHLGHSLGDHGIDHIIEYYKGVTSHPRGRGRTTEQMLEAPEGAVFIWHSNHKTYVTWLAIKLQRTDLQIHSLEWLRSDRWRGMVYKDVIVDHHAASMLTSEDYQTIACLSGGRR